MEPEDNPAVEVIATLNQDIIHDMSFDWYGKRIATCSSDKTVRIYGKNNEGKWIEETPIPIQGGALWRVKWARPEFGLILATCSLDRTIKIFEKKNNKWIEQTKISDSKESIEDIKFSPRHNFGLILAAASADGNLRIYQAVPTNLKNWQMKSMTMVNEMGLNCLSLNKSQSDKMMIVVGCKDAKTTYKKTTLPLNQEVPSTNTETLRFFRYEQSGLVPMKFPYEEMESVNDVSWALMNGRSYHLVASATDTCVRIFYLRIDELNRAITIDKNIQLMGCGMRLSWNVMSTQLAVSEPKRIRLYKNDRTEWSESRVIEQNNGD